MNRLFEIANRLGEIARTRYQQHDLLKTVERSLKSRERAITPEGGWPGKNADERKAAELAALSADEQYFLFDVEKRAAEDKLASLEAEREALTEERDAIRWTIRDNENVAFSGWSVLEAIKAKVIDNTVAGPDQPTMNEPKPGMCACGHEYRQHDTEAGGCTACKCESFCEIPF